MRRILAISFGSVSLVCTTAGLAQTSNETGSPGNGKADLVFGESEMVFDETAAPAAEPESSGQGTAPAKQEAVKSFWAENIRAPMRITLAQEASYKLESPDYIVKNRSSARLEYSKYFLDHFFLQLDAKSTAFLREDHRHDAEGTDTRVSQAYVQGTFKQTSINAGLQTIAWGESILAPITDEVSPRDNREAFNFNLEELRIGQPMLTVDQYSAAGRWSAFFTPDASFNKNPERGSAYYVNPFGDDVRIIKGAQPNGGKAEYGASWRKSFGSADFSVVAASLIDNDYALRRDDAGRIVQEQTRYSLSGMTFSYAIRKFLVKGEMGIKSGKAYTDALLQIVKKDAVDSYLGLEYRHSASLSLGVEAINQHVAGWESDIQSAPRDRQSLLLTLNKLMLNDDLSINVLNFYNRPNSSMLTMLLTSFKWNDNLTLGLNAIYPYTDDEQSPLWSLRDQKQLVFRVQYQF